MLLSRVCRVAAVTQRAIGSALTGGSGVTGFLKPQPVGRPSVARVFKSGANMNKKVVHYIEPASERCSVKERALAYVHPVAIRIGKYVAVGAVSLALVVSFVGHAAAIIGLGLIMLYGECTSLEPGVVEYKVVIPKHVEEIIHKGCAILGGLSCLAAALAIGLDDPAVLNLIIRNTAIGAGVGWFAAYKIDEAVRDPAADQIIMCLELYFKITAAAMSAAALGLGGGPLLLKVVFIIAGAFSGPCMYFWGNSMVSKWPHDGSNIREDGTASFCMEVP